MPEVVERTRQAHLTLLIVLSFNIEFDDELDLARRFRVRAGSPGQSRLIRSGRTERNLQIGATYTWIRWRRGERVLDNEFRFAWPFTGAKGVLTRAKGIGRKNDLRHVR